LINQLVDKMRITTKKKYLKIYHTYKQIIKSLGPNASYISKSRIIELVSENLFIVEKITLSRDVFYKALKYGSVLEKEEMYME
jgi:hypothetical protein